MKQNKDRNSGQKMQHIDIYSTTQDQNSGFTTRVLSWLNALLARFGGKHPARQAGAVSAGMPCATPCCFEDVEQIYSWTYIMDVRGANP